MPKKLKRKIKGRFLNKCFKPCGVRAVKLETIFLKEEEIEAIRLADLEKLYQEDAAKSMGVSRPTFSRIISNARAKIADALINGKNVEIE